MIETGIITFFLALIYHRLRRPRYLFYTSGKEIWEYDIINNHKRLLLTAEDDVTGVVVGHIKTQIK